MKNRIILSLLLISVSTISYNRVNGKILETVVGTILDSHCAEVNTIIIDGRIDSGKPKPISTTSILLDNLCRIMLPICIINIIKDLAKANEEIKINNLAVTVLDFNSVENQLYLTNNIIAIKNEPHRFSELLPTIYNQMFKGVLWSNENYTLELEIKWNGTHYFFIGMRPCDNIYNEIPYNQYTMIGLVCMPIVEYVDNRYQVETCDDITRQGTIIVKYPNNGINFVHDRWPIGNSVIGKLSWSLSKRVIPLVGLSSGFFKKGNINYLNQTQLDTYSSYIILSNVLIFQRGKLINFFVYSTLYNGLLGGSESLTCEPLEVCRYVIQDNTAFYVQNIETKESYMIHTNIIHTTINNLVLDPAIDSIDYALSVINISPEGYKGFSNSLRDSKNSFTQAIDNIITLYNDNSHNIFLTIVIIVVVIISILGIVLLVYIYPAIKTCCIVSKVICMPCRLCAKCVGSLGNMSKNYNKKSSESEDQEEMEKLDT